ncbi:MAG: ATP-binding cassette domain-containing protein [Proteobacteria bacterium]|nr:ATP-binding cassette domain-containing protein [Pseudomonadota bacterium]
MSALVTVENLTRVFDVSKPWLNRVIEGHPKLFLTAVDDVSFSIPKGKTFALVGESGSGKSTIAKMIVGLVRPTSGRIAFDGTDMAGIGTDAASRRLRSRFQMIFQDPYASLNPRMRVGDIIAEPLRTFGLETDRAAVSARVSELLRLVKLDPRDSVKFPHEFSGGQRQRIAIARALAGRPEFIVCDEPTSALDVSVQAQILNLMRDLQEEFGLTYLFISHNLAVVRHMASEVGVLYLGRLVETAPTRQLFAAPSHPYTRMLLESVPDIGMTGRARMPPSGEIPNPINPPAGCHYHPRCPLVREECRRQRPPVVTVGADRVMCFAAGEPR